MGFNLAEAYVQLSSRGISSVMGSLDGVRSKLGMVAGFATGPLGVALAGLGAGASIGGLIKMSAEAEQTRVAFGVMLGGADNAKKMLADLNNFAAKTPFELPGILQASKSLLAFGTSQDQVLPLLEVLGNVSAGTGKDLSELAVIFGQISATGRLTGQDLMQLTNAGVPMLAELGKQLGKSTGEVKKMVEEGKISLPMVTQAFQSMSGESGLFSGMMEKQSKTIGGLWSTLKDTIGQSLLKIGDALVENFNVSAILADLQGFAETIASDWIPNIVAGFKWLGANIVTPFISAIKFISQVVGEFIGNFDIYWQLASLFVSNFALNGFERIKTFGINIVEVIAWAMGNWREILLTSTDYMLTVLINLGQNIRNVWQGVLDFIAGNGFNVDFTPLSEGFHNSISKMPELTKANIDQLRPQIDQAYEMLNQRANEAEALKMEREQAKANKSGTPGAALNMGGGGGGTGKGKDAKAEFVGIAQLAEKMQQQAGAKADTAKQLQAAEKTALATDKMAAAANGEGLKVRMAESSAPPTVNFAFGGG